MNKKWIVLLSFAAAALAGCASTGTGQRGIERIEHIVVIYAENRSFDHLYGSFPGAEGIAQATAEQKTQLDATASLCRIHPRDLLRGKTSPQAANGRTGRTVRSASTPRRSTAASTKCCRVPGICITRTASRSRGARTTGLSPLRRWSAPGVMGYFDGSQMKLWKWAQNYTLADHFFMGAFGGSFLNHQWLICCLLAGRSPGTRRIVRPTLDPQGNLARRPGSPKSHSKARFSCLTGA